MTTLRRALTAAALATLAACGGTNPNEPMQPVVPEFRGLLATPRQLAFTCVVPGCDSSLSTRISSTVNRRVAIKRIVLSDPNAEYTITSDQPAPFILGAASEFNVDVRFAPVSAPRSESLKLLITYTDASAEEGPDRIEPGELQIPLVKRLVGEPLLAATPEKVNFGVVAVDARRERPVTVKNVGFGNIALQLDAIDDAGIRDLRVDVPSDVALVPDAGLEVAFVFLPTTEKYLKGRVTLRSPTPGVDPVDVDVEGTSFTNPRIALEPEETALEFGEIVKGTQQVVTVRVANVGGGQLDISSLSAVDPSGRVKVSFPDLMTSASLQPLQRINVEVEIDGTTPGVIDVPLRLESNDPVRPMLEIPIRAVITEPQLATDVMLIDWGTVPQGWVVPKAVELKNTGYGTLTIKAISFVGGQASVFTLGNLPALPYTLARDERVAFDVELRAQAAANFTAAISIESDDPQNQFREVQLKANVGSCAASCPIINGTASCAASGVCEIGACNTGWYDTNLSAADGCECREVGTDPSNFCSMGVNKGTLADNGSNANHTGIIHSADDEDYILFYAQDNSQVFSEDFDVNINLTSSDPGITMCVSRYDTGTSVNECYADSNKTCGIRSLRRDGSYGREDGAMFYIKVYRTASSTPSCTPYTVTMRNG